MHPYRYFFSNISGRPKDFIFIRCLNCFQLTFEDRSSGCASSWSSLTFLFFSEYSHKIPNLIHVIVIVLEVSRFTFICLVCVGVGR